MFKSKFLKLKDNFTKLNLEFINVKGEKEYYARLCETKNITITNLQKNNSELNKNINNLITENIKLINWIMNILDTVGTMEVREKTQIKIPVYMHKEYRAYETNYMGVFEKERITIPEITIVKMG